MNQSTQEIIQCLGVLQDIVVDIREENKGIKLELQGIRKEHKEIRIELQDIRAEKEIRDRDTKHEIQKNSGGIGSSVSKRHTRLLLPLRRTQTVTLLFSRTS